MRQFDDEQGRSWVATVEARPDGDYKGRYHLVLRPRDGNGGEVDLDDVRWNSERTAERTLETMSLLELRRRLRWGLSRSDVDAVPY